MKTASHICIAIMASALLFLCGCTHKTLCYDHSHVNEVDVYFDWSNAPDAEPESMGLFLYPQETKKLLRFSFGNHRGGKVRLKNDIYHAICINDNTRNIATLNINDFNSFEINTKDQDVITGMVSLSTKSIPRAKGAEEERIATSPEIVWSNTSTDNVVNMSNTTIRLHPECNVIKSSVTINNAENLRWVKSVSATISSMAGGYLPQHKKLTEEEVTLVFECSTNPDKKQITGKLTTFGCCPSIKKQHILTIYTILADDTKWYYQIDVTDQVHDRKDPYNIIININKLPIPEPDLGNGGFSAGVDEWNEVIYDIKM